MNPYSIGIVAWVMRGCSQIQAIVSFKYKENIRWIVKGVCSSKYCGNTEYL